MVKNATKFSVICCHAKTTFQEGVPGMNVPWWKMSWFLYSLVHDLGKYVRSPLEVDPYNFKAQGVLGTLNFTFYNYLNDTIKLLYIKVLSMADSFIVSSNIKCTLWMHFSSIDWLSSESSIILPFSLQYRPPDHSPHEDQHSNLSNWAIRKE